MGVQCERCPLPSFPMAKSALPCLKIGRPGVSLNEVIKWVQSADHLFLSPFLLLPKSFMSSEGPSSRENNAANGCERIDTSNQPEDPRAILKLLVLAERALRYSVNLNGFVEKNNGFCVRGGYAMVWPGVLHLNDAIAAEREITRNHFLGNGDTVKVNLLLAHDTSL